jgi:Bacterial protein of unknown function (DUF899)
MADEADRDGTGAESGAAAPPNGSLSFAKKARDLEVLRSTVIEAASVGAGLWLSYLFVLFYLAIAVGSVTHRKSLVREPVKLPFLNVDLPLIGSFVLGPGIFLIVHAYMLLHFVLLADKVGAFHAELVAQVDDEDARTRLHRQLPSNIFVQFLAEPREVRTGVMSFLLRLIAQISLVAGPRALLVLFELQFLPYHHEPIVWWQRVVLDLALLWALWPSVARGETVHPGWRDFRRGRVMTAALWSVITILLVFTTATFPGKWLDDLLHPRRHAFGGVAAPLAKLQAYKRRIAWNFPWASSLGSDFNVSFTEEQQRGGASNTTTGAAATRWTLHRSRRPSPSSRPPAEPTRPPTRARGRAWLVRARRRRPLPHLFDLCARTGRPLRHVPVARPRPQGAQPDGRLVAPPRRVRQALSQVVGVVGVRAPRSICVGPPSSPLQFPAIPDVGCALLVAPPPARPPR